MLSMSLPVMLAVDAIFVAEYSEATRIVTALHKEFADKELGQPLSRFYFEAISKQGRLIRGLLLANRIDTDLRLRQGEDLKDVIERRLHSLKPPGLIPVMGCFFAVHGRETTLQHLGPK